jgi:hypothetical protein
MEGVDGAVEVKEAFVETAGRTFGPADAQDDKSTKATIIIMMKRLTRQ